MDKAPLTVTKVFKLHLILFEPLGDSMAGRVINFRMCFMDSDNTVVTCDLSQFGYREMGIAHQLLHDYSDSPPDFLGDGITLNFNMNSGYVFLCDEDFNCGMLNDDGILSQFVSCGYCGAEGFIDDEDLNWDSEKGYCGMCSETQE